MQKYQVEGSKQLFLDYYYQRKRLLLRQMEKGDEPHQFSSILDHYNRQIIYLGGNSNVTDAEKVY